MLDAFANSALLAEQTFLGKWGLPFTLLAFIAASVWLGTVAQRAVEKGSFVKGYFLGNRGLGAWALALTATVQSGGTFMGFPALCYKHGWVGLMFIGSYMVVPLMGFAILGKRVAQISRKTGAVTLPDLLRARFDSPALGLLSSLSLIAFMTIMIVPQFKAGAILMKLVWPDADVIATLSQSEGAAAAAPSSTGTAFYVGMAFFAVTVVGYTLIGGFLAAVWTDLFQSVMMFFGVIILLALAIRAAGGDFPAASERVFDQMNATAANGAAEQPREARRQGAAYGYGPGFQAPSAKLDARDFLPLLGALSMCCTWPLTNFSSPAGVVRIMACKDTRTMRRSIILLCIYNMFIYVPIAVTAILARVILEKPPPSSDEVIPVLAKELTKDLWGGPLIGGLILAAPFGAVMATVSGYLVLIASGMVRDVYQRLIRPNATAQEAKWVAYASMIAIGVFAVVANINPPSQLQAVVIFSSTCTAAAFMAPLTMCCFWRRANKQGAIASMMAGVLVATSLYAAGIVPAYIKSLRNGDPFDLQPYSLFGLDPIVYVTLATFLVGIVVTLVTPPPPEHLVAPLFDAPSEPTAT